LWSRNISPKRTPAPTALSIRCTASTLVVPMPAVRATIAAQAPTLSAGSRLSMSA